MSDTVDCTTTASKIAIFSFSDNQQTKQLIAELGRESSQAPLFFDLALNPPDRIVISQNELLWNDVSLADLDTALLHGFSYQDPIIPPGQNVDFSLWRYDYLLQQQKYSAQHSLFSELSRRDVNVINPPQAHLHTFMKQALLDRVRVSGWDTPEILTTNCADEAKAFCSRHPSVVWRPATGIAAYQLFQEKQLNHLMQAGSPAVMLAEVIPGPFIRGYIFKGEPWLMLQFESPSIDREEVLEVFWDMPCSEELQTKLSGLHAQVDASWLQISFVLADGKPFIYDIDADPLYQDLPACHGTALTKRLAKRIMGDSTPFDKTDSTSTDESQQRPAMFLRRMLDILYDFERSKYS